MNEERLRKTVKLMYPLSKKWAKRIDKMNIGQVYAIHLRQCRLEEEEVELRKARQALRDAMLDERSQETNDLYLQGVLF